MPDTLGFDPSTRRETWLFQRMYTENGKPVYRRLGYNLVSYDGSPDRLIEPISSSLEGPDYNASVSGDPGACAGFEFYDARPFEAIALNDVTID